MVWRQLHTVHTETGCSATVRVWAEQNEVRTVGAIRRWRTEVKVTIGKQGPNVKRL